MSDIKIDNGLNRLRKQQTSFKGLMGDGLPTDTLQSSPEKHHISKGAIALAVLGLGAVGGGLVANSLNSTPSTGTSVVVPTTEGAVTQAPTGTVFAPTGAHQYTDNSLSNPAVSKATTSTASGKSTTTTKTPTTTKSTTASKPTTTSVKVKLTATQTSQATTQTNINNMLKNGKVYVATKKFDTKNPGKPLTTTTQVQQALKKNQPIYWQSNHQSKNDKGNWVEFRNQWDFQFYSAYYMTSMAAWETPVIPVYVYPVWSDPGYYDGTCGINAPGTCGSDVGPDGCAPIQGTCTVNGCNNWSDCAPPTCAPYVSCNDSTGCAPLPTGCSYPTDCTPTQTDCTPTQTDCTPTQTDCTPTQTDCTPTQTDCTPTQTDCTPTQTDCTPSYTDCTPSYTDCTPSYSAPTDCTPSYSSGCTGSYSSGCDGGGFSDCAVTHATQNTQNTQSNPFLNPFSPLAMSSSLHDLLTK